MNWKKALGFGILIWIIMFIVYSALVGYGLLASGQSGWTLWSIVALVITLLVTYFVARNAAPGSYGMALGYGVVFAVVGIVLDYFITTRFVSNVFSSMGYWVTYLLIVLTPLAAVKKMSAPSMPEGQM